MQIYGLTSINTTTFGSLNTGETFCTYKSIASNSEKTIMIKCYAVDGYNAVDLKTGNHERFADNEPVVKVDAYVQIKEKERSKS